MNEGFAAVMFAEGVNFKDDVGAMAPALFRAKKVVKERGLTPSDRKWWECGDVEKVRGVGVHDVPDRVEPSSRVAKPGGFRRVWKEIPQGLYARMGGDGADARG
jgi:hypothetical protein